MSDTKTPRSIHAYGHNRARWHGYGSDWATPDDLFASLDREFHFTTDACASDWNAKCNHYYSREDDGLTKQWGGTCWMNPPYGKEARVWVAKAHAESHRGATVVCLLTAAVDQAWWHDDVIASGAEIRWLRGRPRFRNREGKWQQIFSPSVIVIFRPHTCGEGRDETPAPKPPHDWADPCPPSGSCPPATDAEAKRREAHDLVAGLSRTTHMGRLELYAAIDAAIHAARVEVIESAIRSVRYGFDIGSSPEAIMNRLIALRERIGKEKP